MVGILLVILSSDCEPDRDIFIPDDDKKNCWGGIENGIPALDTILRNHEDSYSTNAKMCWMLRSDDYMNTKFGDYALMAKKFKHLWKQLVKNGDEIGWHPHLTRNIGGALGTEMEDCNWIDDCLTRGLKKFSSIFKVNAARMGHCYHNNFTMNKISELGLKIDLTALPGMSNKESLREVIKGYVIKSRQPAIDWMGVATYPYHPSRYDYRSQGTESLDILEIPVSTLRTSRIDQIKNFNKLSQPTAYYLNYHLNIVKKFIDQRINEAKTKTAIINGFLHPDEINLPKSKTYVKVAYRLFGGKRSFDYFDDVLSYIEKKVDAENVQLMFCTPSEAFDYGKETGLW